jgi:hypothetical protein
VLLVVPVTAPLALGLLVLGAGLLRAAPLSTGRG